MRKIFGGAIVIIVIAAAAWFVVGEEESPEESSGEIIAEVTFHCESGKSIEATFREELVAIVLSDGREMDLPQAISASGARYANEDESIVFWNKGNTAFLLEDDQETYTGCIEEGAEEVGDSAVYQSEDGSFSVQYPSVFEIEESNVTASSEWSYSTAEEGVLGVKLRIPGSYQPETNFQEAVFLVGWSTAEPAVQQCLDPAANATETKKIELNGETYAYSKQGDAGAGNFYEVDQYRTIKDGRCYSIEQMIHSTNLDNYPSDQGITAFDQEAIKELLDEALARFRFIE